MKREVLRAPSVPIYMSLRNRNFPQHATVKAQVASQRSKKILPTVDVSSHSCFDTSTRCRGFAVALPMICHHAVGEHSISFGWWMMT